MEQNASPLWRAISDRLIQEIEKGDIAAGTRLPADTDLAIEFGVNRHTVRRALSYMQAEGILRSERGRGTFVVDDVMEYRLGARTRFTENLLAAERVPGRKLVSLAELPAPVEVANDLKLSVGAPVVLAVVRGEADNVPLSLGRNYFPAERLPGLAAWLRAHLGTSSSRFSITSTLKAAGVIEYRRRSTRIIGRAPNHGEAKHLKMSLSECVLETESVDVDVHGRPIIYARTCFRSSRIQFVLES